MASLHSRPRPSQEKAIEVARLLSDLSESDKTPCIATKSRLREYERVVHESTTKDTTEKTWDRLLALLKGLTQGKEIFGPRPSSETNTATDTIDWLDHELPTAMSPTQLCTIVEECTPNCGGCRSPVWRSSTVEEIEEELELALQHIEDRTPYQLALPVVC